MSVCTPRGIRVASLTSGDSRLEPAGVDTAMRALGWAVAWSAFAVFCGVAFAAPYMAREILFEWTPCTGPVEQYQCELADGTLLLTPTAEISFRPSVGLESIRCRGMDAEFNPGPWSEYSAQITVQAMPTDANKDGVVGIPDFILWRVAFGDVGWEISP